MSEETPDPPPQHPRKLDAWDLVCTGILRTEFGRRPSRALSDAIMRLAAEDAAARLPVETRQSSGFYARLRTGWRLPQPRVALAFCLMIVAGAGLAVHWLHQRRSADNENLQFTDNRLTDDAGARWGNNSPRLVIGGKIPAGWLKLDSGVAEITFASTAKVAVEGPAQFQVTGPNSIELQGGKISTDVPRHAKGFSLKTPTATVVDLGTRFGAIVGSDHSSDVDVFQGRVRLTTADGTATPLRSGMAMFVDEHGATAADALPESAFPQPNLNVEIRPQNCGFDVSGRAAIGEVPVDFGYWSGLSYSLTGSIAGISPASGAGMLEFYNSSSPPSRDSEVWQLIDLRPYKDVLASGAVEAKLTALFNRVAGDAKAASRFGLTLAAFHGSPADARSLWDHRQKLALALGDKDFASDNKPETWEPLEVKTRLPPETDFVAIQLRAIASGSSTNLAGHFADRVDFWLCAPMRASSIAIK